MKIDVENDDIYIECDRYEFGLLAARFELQSDHSMACKRLQSMIGEESLNNVAHTTQITSKIRDAFKKVDWDGNFD